MFRLMMFSLLFASAFSPRNAHAHFLFIHLDRPAEAGRSAEVFFSEFATSGDPKFVKKIAHTKLWVQSKPGKFRPIEVRQAYDSLKAFVPDAGTIAVVGKCQYGVLQRNVPFLLQYYPKAIAGDPAEIGKLQPFNEIPLEIVAAFVDGKITFTALHKGKPLPGAKFTTVDQFLDNEEFTADKSGRATWKPPLPGYHCVYTNLTLKKPGELDGKRYEEIRMFATLGFRWPLAGEGADSDAVEIFQRSISSRASWQDFPGFSAKIKGVVDGHPFDGGVSVDADGTAHLGFEHPVAGPWVLYQLGSIAMHRSPSSVRRGKPVLRFADNE